MEQKIKLTTRTVHDISPDEMRRMFTTLSLFEYPYMREPDYKERQMLLRIRNDLRRFTQEVQAIYRENPNNLTISKMCNFIQHQYIYLKNMLREE